MPVDQNTLIVRHATEPLIASKNGREGVRYLVASIAALGLDAGVLALTVDGLGLAPWFGGGLAYGAGLVLIYALSVRWVFAQRTMQNKHSEFVLFAALGVVGLLLNSTVLYIATTSGLALPLAKALSAGIGFTANFVSRKLLLFSKKPQ